MSVLRFLALVVLVGCGHDVARENPLDPSLSTPVQLSLTVRDTLGVVELSWTAYASEPAFARYRVLRSLQDSRSTDTLVVVEDIGVTVWVDSTVHPDSAYAFRVETVNAAGLALLSNEVDSRPLSLPSIQTLSVETRSDSAQAHLSWHQYTGPRFASYEIARTSGGVTTIRGHFEDLRRGKFTDSGLSGGREYQYRVDVVTTDGLRIEGRAVPVEIHPLLSLYDLDIDVGTAARLYAGTEGTVEVLLSSANSISFQSLNDQGEILARQQLLSFDLDTRAMDFDFAPSL